MTELIRNWLMGVTCAAILLALAESLTPEGSVKRICRLAGGVVLLLAAISPVAKLEEADFARSTEQYQNRAEEYRDALDEETEILYESIIAEKTAAYILDKAEELGVTCQVSVTVGWEQDGTPRPAAVILYGLWTKEQKETLSHMITSDLGIPAAMQYFKESSDETES